MSILDELTEAMSNGDTERVQVLQRKLLLVGRNESLDEEFISNIKDKTLGKNLKRILKGSKDFSKGDCIKIVSSLITHNVIESENTGNKLNDYPINELYVLLGSLINGESGDAINECREFIDERYARFL